MPKPPRTVADVISALAAYGLTTPIQVTGTEPLYNCYAEDMPDFEIVKSEELVWKDKSPVPYIILTGSPNLCPAPRSKLPAPDPRSYGRSHAQCPPGRIIPTAHRTTIPSPAPWNSLRSL